MKSFFTALVLFALCIQTISAEEATRVVRTWDGGGGDFLWSNPLNWDKDLPLANDGTEVLSIKTSSGSGITCYLDTNETYRAWNVKGICLRADSKSVRKAYNLNIQNTDSTATIYLGDEGIKHNYDITDSSISGKLNIILTTNQTWDLNVRYNYAIGCAISGDYTLTLSNKLGSERDKYVRLLGKNTFKNLRVDKGRIAFGSAQAIVPTVLETTSGGYKFTSGMGSYNLNCVTNKSGIYFGHGQPSQFNCAAGGTFGSDENSRIKSISLDYTAGLGKKFEPMLCSTNFILKYMLDKKNCTVSTDFLLAPEFTDDANWTLYFDQYISGNGHKGIYSGTLNENNGKINLTIRCENDIHGYITNTNNYSGTTHIMRWSGAKDAREGILYLSENGQLGTGDIFVTPMTTNDTSTTYPNMTVNLASAIPTEDTIDVFPDTVTLTLNKFTVNESPRYGRIQFGTAEVTEKVESLVTDGIEHPVGYYTATELPDYILGSGTIQVLGKGLDTTLIIIK